MIHSIDYLLQDLSTNGSVYDEFTPESYLAAEQLNKLTDYFEDSDRLRTTTLHGVGIVCGFQFSVNKNTSGGLDTIEVTPGVAITTDGDILHTDLKALSSYIPFLNKAVYGRLNANGGNVVELRERRAAESLSEELLPGELPLARLSNSNDYKLVVYLEHYKVDPGLCSATSCNDTGNHVHMDQKFLLVHKDFWTESLMKPDTIFHEHNVWDFYDGLPNLAVNRAVVKPNSSNTISQVYNIFKNEVDKIRGTKKLEEAYIKILDRFDPRIDFVRHGITKAAVRSAFRVLFDSLSRNLDIQYRYDAMRELIETYSEIKSLILHINTDCNPAINSFPKHVSLGPLNKPNDEPCRHRMYYASLHKDKKENLRRFKSLVIRFWQQLKTYSFTQNQPLRITSSRDFESSLGERAVPYYYKYSTTHKHWDQYLVRNRMPRQAHSYHRLGSNSTVQFPNQTSHLDKEFYRIEGHIGMPHDRALAGVVKLKNDYGLAFDVKSVSVHANTKGINWDDYKCHFTDLHSMLNSWQTDFKCLVKGFEQFFGNMTTDGSSLMASQQLAASEEAAAMKDAAKKDDLKEKASGPEEIVVTAKRRDSGELIGLMGAGEQSKKIRDAVKMQRKNDELNCSLAGKVLANNQTGNLAQQHYQFAIMLPTQLYIHALILNYERSWSNFMTDASYLANVQKQIKDFCSDTNNFKQVMTNYIRSLQSAAKNSKANQVTAASASMAIFELINIYNRMKEVCCYTSKLNWLKSEIKIRKERILAELTLNKFVQKHSGIEHKAGVNAGGTFVMVYTGEEEKANPFGSTAQRVIADFTLPYLCSTDCAPSQIVILPPADKPDPTQEYRITNKEKDICEDQKFNIKVEPEKQNETDFIAYKTDFDEKPVRFEGGEPLAFNKILNWKSGARSQVVCFYINDKEQDYKLTVHRKIELDFETVFEDGVYRFINKTEEECEGKMFIQTETKNKQDKEQPWDEKFLLQIGVQTKVTIFCKSKICQPSWTTTLDPKEVQKEKIKLQFAVEHVDPPFVEIVNKNKMKLTDKAYTMFVNNRKTIIKLNTSGRLLMEVKKATAVRFTYDNDKKEGEWKQTIQPTQRAKKTINLGFDPKQMGTGTIYNIENGTNIPLTNKGYSLFVAGKKQAIKLNNKGQLMLDLKKPTAIKITFEDTKRKGEWQRTVGAVVAKKKTKTALLAESKKSIVTIETSMKKKRPRTITTKSMHNTSTKRLASIKSAMSSTAKTSLMAKSLAHPNNFNALDKVAVSQRKAAMPYVEANTIAYFMLLQSIDDTVFSKSVGTRAKGHLVYFKKHAAGFSAGFKKKLGTMQFHSVKAKAYADKFVALMK